MEQQVIEKNLEPLPEETNWAERAAAAEARVAALEAELSATTPRIVTGGGLPPREDILYTAQDIRRMSSDEINSKWQEIKKSLKRFCD